jgi:hypothetical protein
MHGAALALADTGSFAEELGHHGVDVDPLGDTMAMTSVGGSDIVPVGQMGADPYGDGLFTGVKVNEAWQESMGEKLGNLIFKGADQTHPLVDPEELIPGDLSHHGILLSLSARSDYYYIYFEPVSLSRGGGSEVRI